MEYNKSVSNPMLIGALELMKAEPTQAHQKMVSEEIVKAEFLTPATVTPAPPEGTTKLVPGCNVNLPVLTAPNGKQFFVAFSDMTELKKWRDEEGMQTVAMTFDDYVVMMFRKDPQGNPTKVEGFIVNPCGAKLVVPKEMVERYIVTKLAKEKVSSDKQN